MTIAGRRFCIRIVPEGLVKRAQRFIAGNKVLAEELSPVGTAESNMSVHSSLRDSTCLARPPPQHYVLGYAQEVPPGRPAR
jgi:hypothetical protein